MRKRLIAVGIITVFVVVYLLNTFQVKTSYDTERFCKEDSEKAVQTFKDTKWKDFDFYTSCVENITHTSPLSH